MRYYTGAIAFVLFGLAGAAAQAQSAESSPLTGPYAGAQVGWGERSVTSDLDIDGAAVFKKKRAGVDAGVFAGYTAPLGGGLAAGIEADVGFGGKTLSQELAKDVSAKFDPKMNAALTAHLGFMPSNNLMVYGLAGYGGERMTIDIREGDEVTSKKQWSDGIVYGGGVALGLSSNISARVQYRHMKVSGGYSPDQILVGSSFRF